MFVTDAQVKVQMRRIANKAAQTGTARMSAVNAGWIDFLHILESLGLIEIENLESSRWNADLFDVSVSVAAV